MIGKKLHLKPGMRVAVADAPAGLSLKAPGVTVEKSLSRDLDLVMLFATTQKALKGQWPKAVKSVRQDGGAVWVAYPKKTSGIQTETINDADGMVCVDREKRIVTAPKDLQKLFAKNAKARTAFDALAFTHRKEYVVWILDAKKPETRAARLVKTVEMLSKGKKNPSDK